MPAFRIRRFQDEDLAGTALLWCESLISTGLLTGRAPTLAEYRERLAMGSKNDWHIHVACTTNEIVGFVAFELERQWLRQLFVKPAMKRNGVGKALLSIVKQEMPGGFWLRTDVDNRAARQFYEKNGLRLKDESPHPVWGQMVAVYVWP